MSNNQLIPVSDVQTMAIAVAKSGLFGMKTPEQALALMLVAQSEGLHPARAAMEYHVIQGRPTLKADAMLSRFQSAGGKVEWHDYTPEKVSATFSHPQGGSINIEWTMKMAQDAKLTGKDTWRQYPRQMLRARVISEGIRTVFPGVSVGIYTPEEVSDFTPAAETPQTAARERVVEGEVLPPDPTPQQSYDFAGAIVRMASAANEAQLKAVYIPAAKAAKGMDEVLTALTATKDKRKAELSESPKPHAKGTISGDHSESDLSGIGGKSDPTAKAQDTIVSNIVHQFASIGYTIEALEAEYGKRIDEWTNADIDEAGEVFKIKKAEYDTSKPGAI